MKLAVPLLGWAIGVALIAKGYVLVGFVITVVVGFFIGQWCAERWGEQ